jgi:hypothetical protein
MRQGGNSSLKATLRRSRRFVVGVGATLADVDLASQDQDVVSAELRSAARTLNARAPNTSGAIR